MARNVSRRPLTPVGLPRSRHGHKRKGKPVEAWKMDLERDEERSIRGVNLNAIEQIADGVERMMFSWNMETFERGQKMLEALPLASCSEEQNPKVDSTVCQKFPIQSPAFVDARNFLSPLVGHGLQALDPHRSRLIEVSGQAPIVIDRMCGRGSVLEIRRRDPPGSFQISTCEKNVGTERSQAEYSSLWGLTPPPGGDTHPPTPPSIRDCYPVQHDSCPFHLPGLDHHLHVSPRRDEARACSARSETGVVLAGSARCESLRADLPDYVARHGPRQAATLLELIASSVRLGEGGRPVTMPMLRNSCDALHNKFESLIHMTSLQGKELRSSSVLPPEISSVEDLQLALIECATEYEIQVRQSLMAPVECLLYTLDARMTMLRAYKRQTASSECDQRAGSQENRSRVEMATYNGVKGLEPKIAQQQVKKHVLRPEEMIENVKRPDNQPWKQKERSSPELKKSENGVRAFSRLFDRQRRSLDDALHRVDRLQREVVRKDRELVEWQLKEKETKARLHGLEDKLKTSRVLQVSPKLPETRKLLIELPALRESLRSLKEEERKQISPRPQAESALELSDMKSQSDMSDRDCSINSRLHFLEERTSEMDELKLTMSKLAANIAELSVAFKDHVQFVNHRLGAIHGLVTQKKPPPVKSRNSPELGQTHGPQRNALVQLKLAGLDAVEAEREVIRSPGPSPPPSWQ